MPPAPPPGASGEDGYALVAAVASVLVLAMIALSLATDARNEVATTAAAVAQARAAAAADAGIAIAVHGLLDPDVDVGMLEDGRARRYALGDGATVDVSVIDENGLVPINRLDEGSATRLLSGAGLDGEALAVARDSLLDWLDDDDQSRPDGAEFAYYAPQGIVPQNGRITSIDELSRIRGFTPVVVARLRPIVTVDPNARLFDPRHADPRAIAVMDPSGEGGALAIERARELAGQRTALTAGRSQALAGRVLVVRASARLADGAAARREVAVELTRSAARPYVMRDYR